MEIKIMKQVMEDNESRADEIKELLRLKKVFMVNLISSPGSGKTSLLEKTIPLLKEKYNVAVIEGDCATDRDAQRLKKFEIPIIMVNTEGGCHLDSLSIENALKELDLGNTDIIFIENVGNLVCPAEFDLGENIKVAVLSTAEGDDKPIKYPYLFRAASLAILNKIDLLEYTFFSKEAFFADLKNINAELPVIETSCISNLGINAWLDWLESKI